MTPDPLAVPAGASVADFLGDSTLRFLHSAFPVVAEDGRPVGLITSPCTRPGTCPWGPGGHEAGFPSWCPSPICPGPCRKIRWPICCLSWMPVPSVGPAFGPTTAAWPKSSPRPTSAA
ncbi:CBS domain-containing protein [Streptomyces cupreus]|uniref:CBS domain-containing protein n=1 Tax=Streptomyces cupreus TaxID=2759956 RepID=UPI0021B18F9F|nr:CBS domain-containing protein [Streptomyces cupreus]